MTNSWFWWPPKKEFLRELYFSGWTKQDLAQYFHKDISEVDRLLKSYGIVKRPPKPIGQGRVPRNNHLGDGAWIYCPKCRFKHCVCPPKSEGCSFGRVKTANRDWHGHLLNLRDGYMCYSCKYNPSLHREEEWGKPWGQKRRLEIQHILARRDGGTSCLHNLIWLCAGPGGCHTKLAVGRKYGGIPASEHHKCLVCESKDSNSHST